MNDYFENQQNKLFLNGSFTNEEWTIKLNDSEVPISSRERRNFSRRGSVLMRPPPFKMYCQNWIHWIQNILAPLNWIKVENSQPKQIKRNVFLSNTHIYFVNQWVNVQILLYPSKSMHLCIYAPYASYAVIYKLLCIFLYKSMHLCILCILCSCI